MINPKSEIRNTKQIRIFKIQNPKQFWPFEHLNFDIFSDFVLRISNLPNGFTLIELLVVVTLIAIIGLLTTQVFILSFRAQGKTEALKEVKQSGDYVLSVVENMVRNASDFRYQCNTASSTLTIKNPDGLFTTFVCSGEETKRISSISAELEVVPTPTGVPLTSNKVTVSDCSSVFFVVCPTPPLSPKYVFINFTLNQSIPNITPTAGNIVSLDYQTTISLWKYQ